MGELALTCTALRYDQRGPGPHSAGARGICPANQRAASNGWMLAMPASILMRAEAFAECTVSLGGRKPRSAIAASIQDVVPVAVLARELELGNVILECRPGTRARRCLE
jgi:hypothetical protein